jgi:hypothetical protein
MMSDSSIPSREILEAALQGLEAQQQRLDNQIGKVKNLLGKRLGRPPKTGTAGSVTAARSKKKPVLSADARKRIAAAQKKRWAAFHRAQAEG